MRPLEVTARHRDARTLRARGIAMVLCRRLTTLSTQNIGDAFGGRDHSTVLNALRVAEAALARDQVLAERVRILEDMLREGTCH